MSATTTALREHAPREVPTPGPEAPVARPPGPDSASAARRRSSPASSRWPWSARSAPGSSAAARRAPTTRRSRAASSAVSPRVSGQVAKVLVADNQSVKQGDVLVELDPRDLEAKLASARADLEAARAGLASAQAKLKLTEANVRRLAPPGPRRAHPGHLRRAGHPERRSPRPAPRWRPPRPPPAGRVRLDARPGAGEGRCHLPRRPRHPPRPRRAGPRRARAGPRAPRQHRGQPRLLRRWRDHRAGPPRRGRDRAGPGEGRRGRACRPRRPGSSRPRPRYDLAALNLSYAEVRAPVDGVVSRRTVEQGQLVSPDRPLMALVPLHDVWVVANFKEDQLGEMRPGQKATVQVDTYGRRDFQGHVESLAGATGARFALLPPDNASGNFVKVVQRVPVLVRLDSAAGRPAPSRDERHRHRPARTRGHGRGGADPHPGHQGPDHRRRHGRRADGGARHHHRQRRAQRHPRELRHAARSDRLGLHRLHDGQRDRHPDVGVAPAALRLPALLHRLDPDVHRRLGCCAAWRGTCRRWWSSASSRASAAAPSSPPRRPSSSPATRTKEHGMAGALFGLGAITGPLLGPTVGGQAHRRRQLALDLPHQRARWACSPPGWRASPSRSRASSRPASPSTAGASRCSPSAWSSLQYVLEEGNRDGWFEDAAHRGARLRGGHLPRHLRGARAGDRAPGGGLPGVQERQLHRGHRAELPHRHRALRRLVPLLALLRHGHALRGARHRAALPARAAGSSS